MALLIGCQDRATAVIGDPAPRLGYDVAATQLTDLLFNFFDMGGSCIPAAQRGLFFTLVKSFTQMKLANPLSDRIRVSDDDIDIVVA